MYCYMKVLFKPLGNIALKSDGWTTVELWPWLDMQAHAQHAEGNPHPLLQQCEEHTQLAVGRHSVKGGHHKGDSSPAV